MFLSFLFYAFLIYLGYQLLFRLILPVYRTTRRVRRTFREMQEKMQPQETSFSGARDQHSGTTTRQTARSADDDYIDFEEVK